MPKGYFIEPTVFVEPAREADVWQKEIFGPVLSVRGFSTEKQVNIFVLNAQVIIMPKYYISVESHICLVLAPSG